MVIQREPNQEGAGLRVARPFVLRGGRHPARVDLRQYTSRYTSKDGGLSFYNSLASNVRWMAGRFFGRLKHAASHLDPPRESQP
jgi:hypothetical protein